MECSDWEFLKWMPLVKTEGKKPEEKYFERGFVRESLNKIAPPTESTRDGDKDIYVVSDEKATRKEVKRLGRLVQAIIEHHIYPEFRYNEAMRQNMFCSLFDELIRQITVERPELNSILIKIRDYFRQEMYNYEQLYQASLGYRSRKFYIHNIDYRLNELEAESKNLLGRQDKAAKEIERVYLENRKTMLEYRKKGVDDDEYRKQMKYYEEEMDFILNYFEKIVEDTRNVLDGDKHGAEPLEDENLDEEESVDDSTGFSIGEEQLVEEEEEPPHKPRELREIKIEKSKEEPIDKDLIYREDEELEFASEYSDIGSIVSQSLKSEPEIVRQSKSNILETLQRLEQEGLKRVFSISDLQTGFIKKAFDAYEVEEEQQKPIEQLKLNEGALLVERLSHVSSLEAEELEQEESLEEEFEEEKPNDEELNEEDFDEITPAKTKKSLDAGSTTYKSFLLSHILSECESMKQVDTEIPKGSPFMNDPKFVHLRTIGPLARCEDLIPKVKEINFKQKPESKLLDVEEDATKDIEEVIDYPLIEEEISESEFQEGITFKEYLEQLGEECEEEIEVNIETVVEVPEEPPLPAEESGDDLSIGGVSIGKSDSIHSSDKLEEIKTISLEEEESESGCAPLPQSPKI